MEADIIAKEIVDRHKNDIGLLNKVIERLSAQVRRLTIIKILEENK